MEAFSPFSKNQVINSRFKPMNNLYFPGDNFSEFIEVLKE
jgi:hypothetical protein